MENKRTMFVFLLLFHIVISVTLFSIANTEYLSSLHNGEGLWNFVRDSTLYHKEALNLVTYIEKSAWFDWWHLYPDHQNVKVISLVYWITGYHSPIAYEIINGVVWATSLLLIYRVSELLFPGDIKLPLIVSIFFLQPSVLASSTQLLRDPIFILGFCFMCYGFSMFAKQNSKWKWVFMIQIGFILMVLMRSYISIILLTFLILFAVIVFFNKKAFVAPLLVLIIPLIMIGSYSKPYMTASHVLLLIDNNVSVDNDSVDAIIKVNTVNLEEHFHRSSSRANKAIKEQPQRVVCIDTDVQEIDSLIYLINKEFKTLSNDELVELVKQKRLKTKPYTGKNLCKYENAQIKVEGYYKNGKQDGRWTYWFENGLIEQEGNYKDSKQDGKWNWWHENGLLAGEVNYKDGKEDGKSIGWYENGQIRSEIIYKDGKQDGKRTYWFENGQREAEGYLKANQNEGWWTYWYENGQIRLKENYIDFFLVDSLLFDKYDQEKRSLLDVVIASRLTEIRQGFRGYRNIGSSIDADKKYYNFSDVIKYFPRALQIGFLSPFPSNWLKKSVEVGTIGNILAGLEMIIWYFILLGFIYITYKNPSVIKPLSVVFLISILLILLLSYVVPNIGAIYRMRQGYMIPFYLIGAHGLSVMISNFTKIQHK